MTLPRALAPQAQIAPPIRALPAGACDAHVHILGDDFALWDGRVEDPAPGTLADWLGRYRAHMAALGVSRTVFVQSIVYGGDNAVTLAATQALGPQAARAVVLVRDDVDDAALDALADQGAKAVRLNYVHGGILTWAGACAMAPRLAARGMHIQMLLHSHLHLAELAADIRALPVPIVIDHLGWPDLALGVRDPGFEILLALMAEGHVYTKLSAPYRLCPAPYDAAATAIQSLIAANPDRCLWGSDWPHIMRADAKQPNSGTLLNHVLNLCPPEAIQKIWTDSPYELFFAS